MSQPLRGVSLLNKRRQRFISAQRASRPNKRDANVASCAFVPLPEGARSVFARLPMRVLAPENVAERNARCDTLFCAGLLNAELNPPVDNNLVLPLSNSARMVRRNLLPRILLISSSDLVPTLGLLPTPHQCLSHA